MSDATVELECSPATALQAVAEAAEIWGGEWRPDGTGGALTLPASVGIRHGHLAGRVSIGDASGTVRVVLTTERSHYRVHVPSLVVLLLGATGGLFLVVVPFFPALFPLIPAGVLLALAAWFMVAARVRTRGSVEFLDLVRDLVEAPPVQEGS